MLSIIYTYATSNRLLSDRKVLCWQHLHYQRAERRLFDLCEAYNNDTMSANRLLKAASHCVA